MKLARETNLIIFVLMKNVADFQVFQVFFSRHHFTFRYLSHIINSHFLPAIPTLILIFDSRAWWCGAVNFIEILQFGDVLLLFEMILVVIDVGR